MHSTSPYYNARIKKEGHLGLFDPYMYCNKRQKGFSISLAHIIMLINTYWHIPSATHSFWEFDQVTSTYLYWLRRPIRSNLHFSFKQIADLFCIVCPWEFAWRTTPSANSKCSTTCIKMARMEPQLWKRITYKFKSYRRRQSSLTRINACQEPDL